MYGIWCEVWGGVAGHRESWLKVEGEIQRYKTKEEAEAIAADIRTRTRSHATANFRYTAKEFTR
jgi:hypothetical protein